MRNQRDWEKSKKTRYGQINKCVDRRGKIFHVEWKAQMQTAGKTLILKVILTKKNGSLAKE